MPSSLQQSLKSTEQQLVRIINSVVITLIRQPLRNTYSLVCTYTYTYVPDCVSSKHEVVVVNPDNGRVRPGFRGELHSRGVHLADRVHRSQGKDFIHVLVGLRARKQTKTMHN